MSRVSNVVECNRTPSVGVATELNATLNFVDNSLKYRNMANISK